MYLSTGRQEQAWVRRVALNLAANGLRRQRTRLAAVLRLGPPPAVPAVSEESAAVAQALRELPMAQRQVIVLHHLLDLPLDEVARELRVPVGTVKSRLARARQSLAKHLGDPPIEGVEPTHA